MPDYHGYTMDFSWDQAYFIPFIQIYCLCFGWIQIVLACILIYLLFHHSPMYSKEFRNAIAVFHTFTILYDFHHSYRHSVPARPYANICLQRSLTGLTGCGASFAISVVIFMRLRNLLSLDSQFRLSVRLSIVFMTVIGVLFMSNVVGFALYFGDDPRKTDIINRSEFVWLREQPDSLVWGDIFDTPAFDIEVYYLSSVLLCGIVLFAGMLIYSVISLHREKKRLLQMTSLKKFKDQGNRMLLIQFCGSIFTLIIPLTMMIFSVKIGCLSFNPYVLSVSRAIVIFAYLNNSMVGIMLHLIMNRAYQRIISNRIERVLGLLKPAKIEVSMTSSQMR